MPHVFPKATACSSPGVRSSVPRLMASVLLALSLLSVVNLQADTMTGSDFDAIPMAELQVPSREPSRNQPHSTWRVLHLDQRHVASLASRNHQSELNLLCMQDIRCGWFLNLSDERKCNRFSQGTVSSIRLEANRTVRQFSVRCVGYGLLHLSIDRQQHELVSRMISGAETIKLTSVGSAGLFRSKKFATRGAGAAVDQVHRAAEL